MAYKVQVPSGAWHSTDDLTGAELRAIEKATGTPWSTLNPYRDIDAYQAIVAAFAIRDGMDDAEIVEWFNTRTTRQLDDGLGIATEEDLDLPGSFEDGVPLGTGEHSTVTSASSPDLPGIGRPTS